ncbi:SID1 transmembrane family member 1-like isoform X2 [Leguminivora glycinivorella]|uniref:SID1 transmembrane family member 1-like isoform X2 n=1 Tax=Leguminivora glycinivorella TaxID=1035111 RepID=UPI002010A416|nr:SID1 transmembrane family member 1-like isoform X2 [Leguminivora glycinivorella]
MFVLVCLLLCVCARAQDQIVVEVIRLQYEQTHTLVVNRSVEYVVEFVPTQQQMVWPARVTARVSAGDVARPVLLTARQRSGATTWQLPYLHEQRLLYELTRTLCPDGAGGDQIDSEHCDGDDAVRGFTLHVGSTCAAPVEVTLRADPARDFLIQYDSGSTFQITQTAPLVALYRWPANQHRARLIVSAEDEACATVSVQNYTCPIAQTFEEIEITGLRMTVEKSGAVQLTRSSYPYGFLVIAVVRADQRPCRGDDTGNDPDWLIETAIWGEEVESDYVPTTKTITFTVKAALSRGQYVLATCVTIAIFLVFYVGFGALVLARRWEPLSRRIGSLAVLAPDVTDGQPSQTDASVSAASPPRRRRDSTATFDSSDNSDTDSEEEPASSPTTPASHPAVPAPSPGASVPPASSTPVTSPKVTAQSASLVNSPVGSPEIILRSDAPNGSAVVPDPSAGPTPLSSSSQETTTDSNGRVLNESNVQAAGNARPLSEADRPFGLPAQLRLAALARRRARVLRARSDRYLHTLYTVAVFYALPVVQFVAAFQMIMNVSGSLDICYYNFLCAHPAGALADFNHVYSNLGYLLLGALLMIQVRARRQRRIKKPRHEEYGIPAHYGLLSALGAGMMVVALLSASYHVCPNGLNFQFDVAFMYVLAVLSMVKIYQARHPDVNARAHATFGVLAVLIAIVVWGVLGGGALFWGAATVLHVFAVLLLSLRIYYVGQFRLEKQSLFVAARGLQPRSRPLYAARLVLLLIANAVNWVFAIYGLFIQVADFASHLLNVLLANTLLYMLFYLTMKLMHGERPRWYAWCYLGGAVAAWAPALYLFTAGSTDWAAPPAQSRHKNHECMIMDFYDSHDLWHMLSAAALYLSFAAMLTWDDGLSAVRRTNIAVF